MNGLMALLSSIPINSCPDREEAQRDLSSAISMGSAVVMEEFMNTWLLTSESELAKMRTQDRQYRQFLVEFNEVYNG